MKKEASKVIFDLSELTLSELVSLYEKVIGFYNILTKVKL